MTGNRSHELLNEAVGWIAEHISDDEELYNSLHMVIGLYDDEIEECGIDYLNQYFEKNNSMNMEGL